MFRILPFALLLVACDGSTASPDAAGTDGGRDAASPDASLGTPDTGAPVDAWFAVDSGPATDGGPTAFTCTHVIGYSQVGQMSGGWFGTGGAFESEVPDGRWQLRWNGGGGVDRWQRPDYTGWDNPIQSPCAVSSDAPDRVLLSVSGPFGADEAAWGVAIEATVAQIRLQHPTVRQIILQPVVGGPGHAECPTSGGGRIRASWQHAHIDAAIAGVVGGDVVEGMSPEVSDCSDYRDDLGHLTATAAEAIGGEIGRFYAALDRP